MNIKDTLRKKLPAEVKESPEFHTLLSIIEEEGINSIVGLGEYLDKKIKEAREWLDENRTSGTISDKRREKVRELEFLETIKREVMKYL